MNKRTIYSIIAFLIVFGIYAYEHFLNQEEKAEIVSEGKKTKTETKAYFLPTSTTGQIVHHDGYSLSYNEEYEQAEWVAYELKKSHLSSTNFKRPYFEIDQAVKTDAAHWGNYKNSGYDRGHLCPAGDRRYSKEAYDETFLTSNISPQEHEFNSGVWNKLEQKVRYWARKYDGVFVVTGGVLKGQLNTIGEEDVAVPRQFYKIVLDYNNGAAKMIGFLLPHKQSNQPLYKFVVPADSIEAVTDIDFFPRLDDALENKLEAYSDYKLWQFN
ncbi:DNA/RNA non-specific endonuclease [Flavisericum labens]|uniref:DNA/RNA non-specific endonuclease n=1 Tax=Flavisericum labens TaxID=3377112 RepID=UPI00387ADFEE